MTLNAATSRVPLVFSTICDLVDGVKIDRADELKTTLQNLGLDQTDMEVLTMALEETFEVKITKNDCAVEQTIRECADAIILLKKETE